MTIRSPECRKWAKTARDGRWADISSLQNRKPRLLAKRVNPIPVGVQSTQGTKEHDDVVTISRLLLATRGLPVIDKCDLAVVLFLLSVRMERQDILD